MKEITIKGTPTPIHFGMKTIDEFTKRQGVSFAEFLSTPEAFIDLGSITAMTQSGLNEGARKSGSDRRYTEDDVWDMIDEEPRFILEVLQILVESIVPLTDKLGPIPKNVKAAARRKK
jgi:hypothetical protein